MLRRLTTSEALPFDWMHHTHLGTEYIQLLLINRTLLQAKQLDNNCRYLSSYSVSTHLMLPEFHRLVLWFIGKVLQDQRPVYIALELTVPFLEHSPAPTLLFLRRWPSLKLMASFASFQACQTLAAFLPTLPTRPHLLHFLTKTYLQKNSWLLMLGPIICWVNQAYTVQFNPGRQLSWYLWS